eukprot:scaffold64867_cov63-Phaeocystis_antarctica.AAC.2
MSRVAKAPGLIGARAPSSPGTAVGSVRLQPCNSWVLTIGPPKIDQKSQLTTTTRAIQVFKHRESGAEREQGVKRPEGHERTCELHGVTRLTRPSVGPRDAGSRDVSSGEQFSTRDTRDVTVQMCSRKVLDVYYDRTCYDLTPHTHTHTELEFIMESVRHLFTSARQQAAPAQLLC